MQAYPMLVVISGASKQISDDIFLNYLESLLTLKNIIIKYLNIFIKY